MSKANSGIACFLASAMGILSLAGCGPREDEVNAAAPPAVAVSEEVRAELQRKAPDALIGRVIGARPQDQLVAVGEVAVDQFREGDVVSFYGGRDQILGTGVVVAKKPDSLHVRYQPPKAGQRAPTKGDLAIRFRD